MISLLILSHREMGQGLLHAVEHVLGRVPPQVEVHPINYDAPAEQLAAELRDHLARVDQGDGVLILADIYGSSHTNAACRLLEPGRVELVSGVNLPMLIRALNYRQLGLREIVKRALAGGANGITHAPQAPHPREAAS